MEASAAAIPSNRPLGSVVRKARSLCEMTYPSPFRYTGLISVCEVPIPSVMLRCSVSSAL